MLTALEPWLIPARPAIAQPLPDGSAPVAVPPVILVVDDEDDVRSSIVSLFEHYFPGARTLSASSAHHARRVMERWPVSAIVCDYRMPGENGLDFLRDVRHSTQGVRTFLITAYPGLHVAMRAVNESHIDGLFIKPFDGLELIQHIRSSLAEAPPAEGVTPSPRGGERTAAAA